ncbi:hypothetical protein ACWG0P_07100 [Amedibacillus sp. YH-ame6]
MTISESIIEWLRGFSGLDVAEVIETELLGGSIGENVLSKSPTNIVNMFADGSQRRTEYYSFYAKKSSQLNDERITNDKFFEELESWIDDCNYNENYPTLDKKRVCEEVTVSGSYYLFENNEHESIYMLTIQIQYRKER